MGTIEVFAAVAATVVGGISSIEAGEARANALRKREQQEQVAADQKSLQRTSQLQRIIGAQEAAAGARGISVASPSFKTIEATSFNEWAADERAAQLSLDLSKDALSDAASGAEAQGILGAAGAGANLFALSQGGFGAAPKTTFDTRDVPKEELLKEQLRIDKITAGL